MIIIYKVNPEIEYKIKVSDERGGSYTISSNGGDLFFKPFYCQEGEYEISVRIFDPKNKSK